MAKRKPIKQAERRDAWVNPETGHGTSRDHREYTTFRPQYVKDDYARLLWRSDDIIKRIIEDLPSEAFRRSIHIKIGGGDRKDKDKSNGLVKEWERLDGAGHFTRASSIERGLGGAAILPIIEGAVGQLSEPLTDYEDRIGKILALHVFEPCELVPVTWYTRLADEKFRRPKQYRVQPLSGATGRAMVGEIIHESRMIVFPGRRISDQPLIGQRSGHGDSVLNYCLGVVADFGLGWGSAAKIINDFGHGVYKLHNLAEILGEKDGEAELDRRLAAMDRRRSALRAAVVDGEDEFLRIATSVAGLDGLLIQLALRLAAAAEMPVTRLMGMSPAGMNATGESDIRNWYDRVECERQRHIHRVEQFVRLLMLQADGPCAGIEPESWSVEHPPLWQPSEKEMAETRKIVADTDQVYFNMGAVDGNTIAESRWKGDDWSMEMSGIDWDARAKQAELRGTNPDDLTPEELAALGHDPAIAGAGAGAPKPAEPSASAPGTSTPSGPVASDVQKTALNGAQVTALLEIVRAVVNGEIPREAGQAAIVGAFQWDDADAERALGPVGWKPEPKPVPAGLAPFAAPGAKPPAPPPADGASSDEKKPEPPIGEKAKPPEPPKPDEPKAKE